MISFLQFPLLASSPPTRPQVDPLSMEGRVGEAEGAMVAWAIPALVASPRAGHFLPFLTCEADAGALRLSLASGRCG